MAFETDSKEQTSVTPNNRRQNHYNSDISAKYVLNSSALDAADTMRGAGFAVHWLWPKEKRPIGERWSEASVATFADLRASYRPGNNLGVRLGEPSKVDSGGYLHAIDMDIRTSEAAEEAWAALRTLLPGINLNDLPCVQSGSGGESRHLYFITDKPFRSKRLEVSPGKHRRIKDGKEGWSYDWEIELFGTGKQVAMPPSIHPESGKPYVWLREFDFVSLDMGFGPFIPSAEIERLAVAEHATYAFETRDPLDFKAGQFERVLTDIPVSDLHYDDWIRLGQAIHHQTGGSDAGFNLWLEHTKRSTKFTGDKQVREMRRVKWKSFGRYRGQPVTMASVVKWASEKRDYDRVQALHDAFEEEDEDEAAAVTVAADPAVVDTADPIDAIGDSDATVAEPAEWVAKLNRKHAVAFVSGKTVVLTEKSSGGVDYGSVHDLHNFYENVRVPTERGRSEAITKAWMRNPKRRSFPNGIVFAPAGGPAGAYNHWRGFSVEPDAAANCSLLLAHIRDVACSGDDAAFEWVIRWFAHMIQRPWEKPGTALVLKGRKGTGKDTIGDYVGGLFPRHHTKIANPEHLLGRFNAHQEQTLLLHVEEGFWAGDKKAEGSFKHLITSEQVQIEPKGVNAFQVASVLRLFISSNEDWVVPASADERRYCVLNVSPHRAGDAAYFAALRDEMENGGRAALLHYLKSLDLSDFNVRKPPETAGLGEQKVRTLRNIDRWWYETLGVGVLPCPANAFDSDDAQDWGAPVTVGRTLLRTAYREWMKEQRFEGVPYADAEFGIRLRNLCPALLDQRPRDGATRARSYVIPSLNECREALQRQLGAALEWDDGDDD